jgi:hypothetical protein
MGVDTRLESGTGQLIAEVRDPVGYLNWLISLADPQRALLLSTIDPYGETAFERAQLVALCEELRALQPQLSDAKLRLAKEDYLARARSWPISAREDAERFVSALSVSVLSTHLTQVLAVACDAGDPQECRCVRFVGD